jgi:hypothetical protein
MCEVVRRENEGARVGGKGRGGGTERKRRREGKGARERGGREGGGREEGRDRRRKGGSRRKGEKEEKGRIRDTLNV